MPFLPALTSFARGPSGPAGRMHVSRSGKTGRRRHLRFMLTTDLVAMAGFVAGQRCAIAIGIGEDLGAFRIAPVPPKERGLKLSPASKGQNALRLTLCLPPLLHGICPADWIDTLTSPVDLTFRAEKGLLELRCPLPGDTGKAAAASAS